MLRKCKNAQERKLKIKLIYAKIQIKLESRENEKYLIKMYARYERNTKA